MKISGRSIKPCTQEQLSHETPVNVESWKENQVSKLPIRCQPDEEDPVEDLLAPLNPFFHAVTNGEMFSCIGWIPCRWSLPLHSGCRTSSSHQLSAKHSTLSVYERDRDRKCVCKGVCVCLCVCYLQAQLRQCNSHCQGALWVRQLKHKHVNRKENVGEISERSEHRIHCNSEAHRETWHWTSTYIIFITQVDAADFHLQVLDHLSGQFLHKCVLLLLLRFLCISTTWHRYLSLTLILILILVLGPGPGPET